MEYNIILLYNKINTYAVLVDFVISADCVTGNRIK